MGRVLGGGGEGVLFSGYKVMRALYGVLGKHVVLEKKKK